MHNGKALARIRDSPPKCLSPRDLLRDEKPEVSQADRCPADSASAPSKAGMLQNATGSQESRGWPVLSPVLVGKAWLSLPPQGGLPLPPRCRGKKKIPAGPLQVWKIKLNLFPQRDVRFFSFA